MTAWLKDVIGYGLHAARPAAGSEGALYYETDTTTLFRDNGVTWDALAIGGGGAGAFTKIDEVRVGLGGAATIAFSGIANTYRHLHLVCKTRCSAAGSGMAIVNIELNGDTTGGHYSNGVANTQRILLAAEASAPSFLGGEIVLFDYAAADPSTTLQGRSTRLDSQEDYNPIYWTPASAAAIDAVVLTPASGIFVQGSMASLYGLS